VIVAIAESQPKRPFFSLEERVEMAQEVLLARTRMPKSAVSTAC
jgi:phosphopantetheine adenylyltransferase